MLLCDLRPGQTARIVVSAGKAAKRLATLGFVPGTRVRAEQPAPGGDPCVYSLRGYTVAMRRALAEEVEVKE